MKKSSSLLQLFRHFTGTYRDRGSICSQEILNAHKNYKTKCIFRPSRKLTAHHLTYSYLQNTHLALSLKGECSLRMQQALKVLNMIKKMVRKIRKNSMCIKGKSMKYEKGYRLNFENSIIVILSIKEQSLDSPHLTKRRNIACSFNISNKIHSQWLLSLSRIIAIINKFHQGHPKGFSKLPGMVQQIWVRHRIFRDSQIPPKDLPPSTRMKSSLSEWGICWVGCSINSKVFT